MNGNWGVPVAFLAGSAFFVWTVRRAFATGRVPLPHAVGTLHDAKRAEMPLAFWFSVGIFSLGAITLFLGAILYTIGLFRHHGG
jgi:hypothetical protein